jgi:hypothetical protein
MIGIEVMWDVSRRKDTKSVRNNGQEIELRRLSPADCESTFPGIICGQARQSKPETGPGSTVAHQTTMPPLCRHREWRKV